jgi:hypothetical protein
LVRFDFLKIWKICSKFKKFELLENFPKRSGSGISVITRGMSDSVTI